MLLGSFHNINKVVYSTSSQLPDASPPILSVDVEICPQAMFGDLTRLDLEENEVQPDGKSKTVTAAAME
jgi:hypothetical protein